MNVLYLDSFCPEASHNYEDVLEKFPHAAIFWNNLFNLVVDGFKPIVSVVAKAAGR